jgi:insulysin
MLKRIVNLTKSLSDKRNYLYKELPNKLKVLIISDMDADKSAGAMNVNIGSLSDPDDFPGLAHFCEHMLFMGTEKYPKEDEYSEFLNNNSGSYNAYTDLDVTNYYFEISNEAFEEALERFSQFFLNPLFISDVVEREMQAVDSENKKNLQNDIWRFMQLQRSETNSNSAFNKFSTGNLETLNKPHIRDALLEMHGKLYSSNLMSLCILSNKSIEESEKLVDSLFKDVRLIENLESPKFDGAPAYDANNSGYFYKVVPVKDSDKLVFYWFINDDTSKHYKIKPFNYLSSLFGHEGPSSLCSSLVKDDLISELVSGNDEIGNTYSKFYINLTLTKKGLTHYQEIIDRVLHFVKKIKSQPVNKRFYEEIQQIAKLKYDFKNKENAMDYTSTLAYQFKDMDPEDILTGSHLFIEYDEQIISKYLQSIQNTNMNIYFITKQVENECNESERWYGTKYSKEKMNEEFFKKIEFYSTHHSLDYPPQNLFIPLSLDLHTLEHTKNPEKIIDEKGLIVWYKKDNTFNLPKAIVLCQVYINKNIRHHVEYDTIAYLWNSLIQNELQEISYMAKEANIDFKIHVNNEGFYISVSGFNHSIYNAIAELIKIFKSITIKDKEEKLKTQIKRHIQEMTNFYYRLPYSQGMAYVEYLLVEPSVTPAEKLNVLTKGVTIEELEDIVLKMFSESRFEWLVQGNILPDEAVKIAKLCQELIQNEKLEEDMTQIFRTVNIEPKSNFVYTLDNVNPAEENSVICSFYQAGKLDNSGICKLLVIESLLKEKFFNELRTRQALGYIAMLFLREYKSNYGLMCLVQSAVKSPEYIWARINEFFDESQKQVDELSDELFKTHVNAVINEKKQRDLKLSEEVYRNADEIKKHKYQFDRREKQVAILEDMNKEELIKFYVDTFVNNVKRLDVEVISHKHQEENKALEGENLNIAESKGWKRTKARSVQDFKRQNSLYPDFHSII